jgi:hypothetical protein
MQTQRTDPVFSTGSDESPSQFTGHCEDQIGVSDGKDCRHEEWKAKHDTPFRAKLRQRTIRENLLTLQRFDRCEKCRYCFSVNRRARTG